MPAATATAAKSRYDIEGFLSAIGDVPVTTDAHSTAALGYRELGVAQARRAWLTKEQVLNTRPWREIAKLRP